jgi:hypothetical protein
MQCFKNDLNLKERKKAIMIHENIFFNFEKHKNIFFVNGTGLFCNKVITIDP